MNTLPALQEPNKYTYRTEMITPLKQLLYYYVRTHSKTMVIRFDLSFPQDYPLVYNNNAISETIAYIVKKYGRRGLEPMYFWCMEQKKSSHPHYHVVLFLDGQKVRSYDHVFYNVQEAWGRSLGVNVSGCVHHCNTYLGQVYMDRNGLQIRRCDGIEAMQQQMQAVYNQISYLAKEDTKLPANDGLRNFGMSRLPQFNV